MKNMDSWHPSKFLHTRRGWRASREAVGPGSRLVADILARVYTQAIDRYARGDLLDLGCGRAPLYGAYRERVETVVCVDWTESQHPHSHVDYHVDLNRSLPLPAASFDTILATDLVEHIAEPAALWSEMSRLLRPGGTLLLGVPFFYWIHEAPHDYHRYTSFALRHYCDRHGFDVLSLEAYGGSPEIALDFVGKHLARASRILAELLYSLGTVALGLRPTRWLSSRTSTVFPLGYCLVARRRQAACGGGAAHDALANSVRSGGDIA